GESTAAKFYVVDNGAATGHSGYKAAEDDLMYNQRSLTNVILQGTHKSTSGNFELEWKLSPTLTKNEDPDIRKTAFTFEAVDTALFAGAGGTPTRIWRNLEEFTGVGKIDVTQKYKNGLIKVGAAYTYKQREFAVLQYNMRFLGAQNWNSFDPNEALSEENIINNNIWYNSGNPIPNPNEYNSNASTIAGYISNEYEFFSKLKTILGVRVENFSMYYSGVTQAGNEYDNEEMINSTNFFPTANLIFAITDNVNLRGGYTRTIARPSFKEMSFAQIMDPISSRTFNGGFWAFGSWDGNLKETNINNFDLRLEFFPSGDQVFSISGFYKTFKNPIELV